MCLVSLSLIVRCKNSTLQILLTWMALLCFCQENKQKQMENIK